MVATEWTLRRRRRWQFFVGAPPLVGLLSALIPTTEGSGGATHKPCCCVWMQLPHLFYYTSQKWSIKIMYTTIITKLVVLNFNKSILTLENVCKEISSKPGACSGSGLWQRCIISTKYGLMKQEESQNGVSQHASHIDRIWNSIQNIDNETYI